MIEKNIKTFIINFYRKNLKLLIYKSNFTLC